MMKMNNGLPEINGGGGGRVDVGEKKWELRPGGMLVQKRSDSDQNRPLPPPILVRVKHGSIYHEIYIGSQSSFGDLKKKLSGITGLHHQDQKLFYKDKERDSEAYLDSVGVKNKSKLVLVEDAISQEKRFLEMRKAAKMEKSAKSISAITSEVDRLSRKVTALESIVSKGSKVVENDLVELIESLMNQLVKLDGVFADGNLKSQKKVQLEKVQKYVEILDVLKIKNSKISPPTSNSPPVPTTKQHQPQQQQQQKHENGNGYASPPIRPGRDSNGGVLSPVQHQHNGHSSGLASVDSPRKVHEQVYRRSPSVVITTQWETFDSAPVPPPVPPPPTSPHTSAPRTTHPLQPSFTWNLL